MIKHLSRRNFLKSSVASGAWILSIHLPGSARAAESPGNELNWQVYVSIRPDNSILMDSPVMEAGQFMRTTGPMMIAEEMDLDWDKITFSKDIKAHLKRKEDGSLTYQYAKMTTGGSFAVRWTWDYLRKSGAIARQMLLEEAANKLSVPLAELKTEKSFVIHQAGNTRLSYGELAGKAAMRRIDQDNIHLKDKFKYRIIGRDTRNIDLRDIVTGKPLFGIDEDYPDCLQVVIDRAPAFGAEVASYNKQAALAVPGVKKIVEMQHVEDVHSWNGPTQFVAAGVAVLADSLWSAIKGKRALQTRWKNRSKYANEDTDEHEKLFREHINSEFPTEVSQNFGDVDKAIEEADLVLERVYEKPIYAHALMEPFNCIVDLQENSVTVITGHQHPVAIAQEVEKITGISGLNAEIICKRSGGAFGRRYQKDWIKEALILATKVKTPIKVTWMREDELERGFNDPAMACKVRAAMKDGKITAYHYKQSQTNAGIQDNNFPQGLVENYRVERCNFNTTIPIGPWRGPQHPNWAFAYESMLDELAYAVGKDPYDFRMQFYLPAQQFPFTNFGAEIKDSGRMAKCYEAVAKMANWKKQRPKGIGLGIASHFCHGSYAAWVLEVGVTNNTLRLNEAWGAIDCGLPINPNHIRSQMEGGFLDGLNAALFNKLSIKKGAVTTNQFDKLRWGRLKDFPLTIHTTIIKNDYPPTGVGEPPTAPAPAALSNAIFAACGRRIRRQPISESITI